MGNVGALQGAPLLIREPQLAAILAWRSHLQQNARENWISPEAHALQDA